MPPTNAAAFDRAAFRRHCRRSLGISESIEARFNRADKPVWIAETQSSAADMLSKSVRLAQTARGEPHIVYAFGPVMNDDMASWYRDSADDWMSVVSPGTIREQLAAIPEGEDITLLINSPGGDVSAATAAGAMLDDRIKGGAGVNARITGDALSAASTLMLRSTSTEIDPMGLVMIHSPWTFAWGNANDLEKQASTLRKIEANVAKFYADRTELSEAEAQAVMEAETWYSAEEAVAAGLIGKVSEAVAADREAEEVARASAVDDLTVLCAGLDARRTALYYEQATPKVAEEEVAHAAAR